MKKVGLDILPFPSMAWHGMIHIRSHATHVLLASPVMFICIVFWFIASRDHKKGEKAPSALVWKKTKPHFSFLFPCSNMVGPESGFVTIHFSLVGGIKTRASEPLDPKAIYSCIIIVFFPSPPSFFSAFSLFFNVLVRTQAPAEPKTKHSH